MKTTLLFVGILTLALSGCDMGSSDTMIVTPLDPNGSGGGIETGTGGGPELACHYNKTYAGFGGQTLEAGKVVRPGVGDQALGADRDRVKGYDALVDDYARVLGTTTPELLTELKNAYGLTPANWYNDPSATAISIYSSFRVAFVGCLSYTAGASFAVAPDVSNAPALCTQLERKFWSREPDADDISTCANFAVTGTTDEPDPNRRWAYTCASVLSASDFLTY